ncbi:hypothetical protein E3N88_09357 [Mikania micrantha]|uniref:Disease resistance R13L4/SHOC-2-like LRR domain-containing protein n=1 Tax=Mikania micrantha TaxID=192012 RepID=A0A5N6PKS5_9ASTR|nr:hypothetical protein E3N88_09357 [Mikania micrantha]
MRADEWEVGDVADRIGCLSNKSGPSRIGSDEWGRMIEPRKELVGDDSVVSHSTQAIRPSLSFGLLWSSRTQGDPQQAPEEDPTEESSYRMPPRFRACKRPRFKSDDVARLTWESKWANDRIEHMAQELRDVNARYAELRSVVQGMESHLARTLTRKGSKKDNHKEKSKDSTKYSKEESKDGSSSSSFKKNNKRKAGNMNFVVTHVIPLKQVDPTIITQPNKKPYSGMKPRPSKKLLETFHLSCVPSIQALTKRLELLEKLQLSHCGSLQDVPSSICNLKSLKYLHLVYCSLVKKLPEEIGSLTCLEELNIEESLEELILSSKVIEHFPDSMCTLRNLKTLELKSCIQLKELPNDLDMLEHLEKLHLSDCISLQEVPNSICNMKSLKYLHLPYCVQVKNLPEEIGSLKCLEELNIEGTGINDLPHSIYEVKGCKRSRLRSLKTARFYPDSGDGGHWMK